MKKFEWLGYYCFLVVSFILFTYNVLPFIASIPCAVVLSLVLCVWLYQDIDKKYVEAIEKHKAAKVKYVRLLDVGYNITWEDYKEIYELCEEIDRLMVEFYSNFYIKDHFKHFEPLPYPHGSTLKDYRRELIDFFR